MHYSSLISVLAAILATTVSAAPVLEEGNSLVELSKRQTGACSQWTAQTRLVGNGSPKDKFLWKQVTDELKCGDTDTCTIEAGEYESITIGANLGGGSAYITGGFTVEKTWETGNSWSCSEKEGEKVCLWAKVPHTEYEVETGSYNACTGFKPSKRYRIASPKKDVPGYHQCSSTDCRFKDAEYWTDT